jgi:hypothetical protein
MVDRCAVHNGMTRQPSEAMQHLHTAPTVHLVEMIENEASSTHSYYDDAHWVI